MVPLAAAAAAAAARKAGVTPLWLHLVTNEPSGCWRRFTGCNVLLLLLLLLPAGKAAAAACSRRW
jgi:hypothetical protein